MPQESIYYVAGWKRPRNGRRHDKDHLLSHYSTDQHNSRPYSNGNIHHALFSVASVASLILKSHESGNSCMPANSEAPVINSIDRGIRLGYVSAWWWYMQWSWHRLEQIHLRNTGITKYDYPNRCLCPCNEGTASRYHISRSISRESCRLAIKPSIPPGLPFAACNRVNL